VNQLFEDFGYRTTLAGAHDLNIDSRRATECLRCLKPGGSWRKCFMLNLWSEASGGGV
jgi:hypothetical protein